jgi:uncharacterized protein YbjT (DUF2867 family)
MSHKTVLVVGATGSIGHLVVEEAVRLGYVVRTLVRTPSKDGATNRRQASCGRSDFQLSYGA